MLKFQEADAQTSGFQIGSCWNLWIRHLSKKQGANIKIKR